MRKGSSKVASALQAKLEGKIAGIDQVIVALESDLKACKARRDTLEETLAMFKETGLADTEESEAAA